jgi:hypothetical protein
VLHMLQWRRWLADGDLPQGFASYLAPSSRGASRPLLSSPSPPFPSLHLRSQFELGPRARGRWVGASAGSRGKLGRRACGVADVR